MGCRFEVARPSQGRVAEGSTGQQSRTFSQVVGFFEKSVLEWFCLFETTPWDHGALLSVRGRRERYSDLITDKSQGPGCDGETMPPI